MELCIAVGDSDATEPESLSNAPPVLDLDSTYLADLPVEIDLTMVNSS